MTTRARRSRIGACFLARRGRAAALAAMLALLTGAADGAAATFEYDALEREVRAKITPRRGGIGQCGTLPAGSAVEEVIPASGLEPFSAEASVVGYGAHNVPPGTATAQQDSLLAQSSIVVSGSLLSLATSYDYDSLSCDWGAYEEHDLASTFRLEFALGESADVVLDAQIDGTPNPPLCELHPQLPTLIEPCIIDVDIELRDGSGSLIARLLPGQPPGHFELNLAASSYTLVADAHTAPRSYSLLDVAVPPTGYEPTTFANYEVTLGLVGAVPATGLVARLALATVLAAIGAAPWLARLGGPPTGSSRSLERRRRHSESRDIRAARGW